MRSDHIDSLDSTSAHSLAPLSGILVAATVLLVPFISLNVYYGELGVLLVLVVGILVVVSLISLTKIRNLASERWGNPAVWLALSIPSFMLIGAAFHPGPNTWYVLLFAIGASASSLIIWDMSREDARAYVVYPLLAAASIQAVIAVAQLTSGHAVVPEWLAVGVAPKVIDGVVRAQGTMEHVYKLAGLGLLAIGCWAAVRESRKRIPVPVMIALGMSAALVTTTFSRGALLGLAATVVALAFPAVRGDRSAVLAAAILVGVSAVTLVITASSWSARVDHSLAADVDDVSLGRVTLLHQAATLIKSEPVVGVGPGQYVRVLEERDLADPRFPWMVHVLPVAFAAENGLPAGLAVTGLLIWLAFAAVRAGPGASAAFFSTVPLLIFDVLHYAAAAGRMMLGVWLGVLAAALRWESEQRSDRASLSRTTDSA